MITNYEALNLGRYMEIDKILRTPAEEIDKQVQIVAVLSGKTTDEVLLLPLADYTAMAVQTAFLGRMCDPAEVDGRPIEVNGLRLVPVSDFAKINTAQYVDFQTFAKEFPSTIPQLLSCFLVPEGKAYNEGYDIATVHEAVRTLTLPVALGLVAFFFDKFKQLIRSSVTSLEKKARKDPAKKAKIREIRKQAEVLLRSTGAGLPT